MVIVSPFFRYTYAFFPPFCIPTLPVREFFLRFAGIVTMRTMRGATLYTAKTACAMLRFVALVATSKRYALCPPAIVPFSVMRGLRSTNAMEWVPDLLEEDTGVEVAIAAFFSVFCFLLKNAIKDYLVFVFERMRPAMALKAASGSSMMM